MNRGYGPAIIAALAALASASTPAQDSAAEAEDFGIQTVVVTALKRETSLQETPVSIAAINEETLNNMGATSIVDYVRSVPGLQVTDMGPGQRRVTLRGIQAAGESTVGLYYDEVPLSGPSGTTSDSSLQSPDVNLFDVERVEVLRGPQGTLYGSGSMGGTLRVIFNKPDSTEFTGAFDGQLASTEDGGMGHYAKGMVNVPLVRDKLAARAVLFREQRAGYIDNPRLGLEDVNRSTTRGGRFMLGFTPADNITLTGSALIQEAETEDNSAWYEVEGDYNNSQYVRSPFPDDLNLYNVTLKWELGPTALTATSSYYEWEMVRNTDWTPVYIPLRSSAPSCRRYNNITTGNCTPAQLAAYQAWFDTRQPSLLFQPMGVDSWNHEVRLSSTAGGKLEWTVGGYFEDREDFATSNIIKADAATGLALYPIDYTGLRVLNSTVEQKALFGEASYTLLDKLTLTAGARRYDYDKTVSGQVLITNIVSGSIAGPFASTDASESGWTTKLNASYKLTDDAMAYATASQGFRPGGANNIPGLSEVLTSYKADKLWNYELGVKTAWFGGRYTANIAAYLIDWTDMQVSARTTDGTFTFLTNVGAAQIEGVEVELVARPLRSLQLSAGLNFSNAELSEDQINNIANAPGRDGDRIPNVPKFSGSAAAQYEWPLGSELGGMARADFSYVGTSYSEFRPDNIYYEKMGDYSLLNLRAGVEHEEWGAYLFVSNVLGEIGKARVTSSSGIEQAVFSTAPRTFGLNVRKSF